MPVFPEVGSMSTVLPGKIFPAVSSASIIATPMRSLTECAGLKNSSFAATVAPGAIPAVTRLSRTSGVFPMSFVMSAAIFMGPPLGRAGLAGARLAPRGPVRVPSARVRPLLALGFHLGDEMADRDGGEKAAICFGKLPVEPQNGDGRRKLLGRRITSVARVERDHREDGGCRSEGSGPVATIAAAAGSNPAAPHERKKKLVHGVAGQIEPLRELRRRDVRTRSIDELDERLDRLFLPGV